MNEIRYIERSSRTCCIEKVHGRWALDLVYGNSKVSKLCSLVLLPLLTRIPLFSRFYGFLQKLRSSKKKVIPFIKKFKIDDSEFAEPSSSFRSFNDFFIRKLKPEVRPIDPRDGRVVLPADGRYLVFPHVRRAEGFYVKGQQFDLYSFLSDPVLAHRFADGAMAIARLCPTDYHRFHFPLGGIPSKPRLIKGSLYSVNPVALRKRLSIFWENKRMVTELETDQVGVCLMVEVGATCVGTIHQTYLPEHPVQKGDEKGYFSFGGSSLVLLFEPGRIQFDEDLIRYSKEGIETRGLFGSSLGAPGR